MRLTRMYRGGGLSLGEEEDVVLLDPRVAPDQVGAVRLGLDAEFAAVEHSHNGAHEEQEH